MTAPADRADCFVSYTASDKDWADWITSVLEDAGHRVIVQLLDFRVGGNFVLDMEHALTVSERLVVVLSPAYLASGFTAAEWSAVFRRDPTGSKGLIVPVKTERFEVTGLLGPRVYIPVFDVDEATARARLLDGLTDPRTAPRTTPPFPGGPGSSVSSGGPSNS
ncbi:toll/interleukin-1 receptor domain-containing protein [Streptomyces sp. NPDC058417]|uniref:toll/interleukin-1 receptor domain-containing protein n=1 Tax=unclassified Streptomyces TaxID=2593676 RepID=UPI00364ED3B3